MLATIARSTGRTTETCRREQDLNGRPPGAGAANSAAAPSRATIPHSLYCGLVRLSIARPAPDAPSQLGELSRHARESTVRVWWAGWTTGRPELALNAAKGWPRS